ncbi:hypothetical protein LCGC14_0912490 [marine sediment metagenome]|uniref:MotA/TolQ/ExbB proton channel domain-containing protein n=1 Tax=marine sediment metagenome TaxID=412755 RepID=A0A0F9NT42_9ZZZZ
MMFDKMRGFMVAAIQMLKSTRLGNSRSGQLVSNIIGSVIGVIMFIAVAIPVTTDIIATANLTGTTLTIVNLLPLFYAIGALLAVVGGFIIGGLAGGRG